MHLILVVLFACFVCCMLVNSWGYCCDFLRVCFGVFCDLFGLLWICTVFVFGLAGCVMLYFVGCFALC